MASEPGHAYMADPQALALSISPRTYCAPSTISPLPPPLAPETRHVTKVA